MSALNLTCIAGLIALGWVASKLHTVASKKWIPVSHHDYTVQLVRESYERRLLSGIEQEWEGLWGRN